MGKAVKEQKEIGWLNSILGFWKTVITRGQHDYIENQKMKQDEHAWEKHAQLILWDYVLQN